MQGEKQKTVQADLLLLFVALIWGFGFVAQRAGMEHVGPYTYNGIRFLLGGICLLPLALRVHKNGTIDPRSACSTPPPVRQDLLPVCM